MYTPWFELLPYRYNAELEALHKLDIDFSEDEDAKLNGILRLHLRIKGSNPNFDFPEKQFIYEIYVVFPESYPWFRPDAYAYQLSLPRHQHLRGKNLCLLNRGSSEWDPTETFGELLESQLNDVLSKGAITDYQTVKEDPREQAEPYSEYYNVNKFAPILFDDSQIPEIQTPLVIKEIGKITVGISSRSSFPCRMAITNTNLSGHAPIAAGEELLKVFSHKSVSGILITAPEHPPITNDPNDVLRWLKSELLKTGKKFTPPNSNVKLDNGGVDFVIGITFPEEVTKGVAGMGWIFLVGGSLRTREDKKAKDHLYLAKAAYIGPAVSKERVPRLLPLSTKTASICGLGALGSFVAVELARCGIGILRLLDFDIVDPPTTVRWPLGLSAAGLQKTSVLAKFIKENYPSTKVEIFDHTIGSNPVEGNTKKFEETTTDRMAADFLIKQSDLLIDATAEEGVTNYLTRIAVRKKLPHVVLYATPGAWGGVVMRWLPNVTEGCWNCMKHWQNDNPDEYVPPVDDQGLVQPPGCGDITFTGASFDLQQVSIAAVRMAVSLLCSKEENGYQLIENDWAVVKLVDDRGIPIFPSWKSQKLTRHSNCGYCAQK